MTVISKLAFGGVTALLCLPQKLVGNWFLTVLVGLLSFSVSWSWRRSRKDGHVKKIAKLPVCTLVF